VCGAVTANGNGAAEGKALAPVERGSLSIVPFLAISVQDTGLGIPPEQQRRVFEEFSQAHGQRSRAQGTGLGLAIVRRLVEMQGGSIWLESIPGEGSTFTFTLLTMAGRQTIPTNDCHPAVSV
jgi:signal transduction histidine kinase